MGSMHYILVMQEHIGVLVWNERKNGIVEDFLKTPQRNFSNSIHPPGEGTTGRNMNSKVEDALLKPEPD